MDFNLYVFIILVALLLFLIINDVFKLINIVNLFDGLLYLYVIVISIIYIDSKSLIPFIIALGIGLIIDLIINLYSYFSNNYIYLLLKYCKKDYNIIKDTLDKQQKPGFSYSLNKKFPLVFVMKKSNKPIFKSVNFQIRSLRKRKFTIYNYWQIIILIIIITIIIRF
ncbi:MAG: hypothetical protein K9L64_00435 [Candidatus Izimaplasma sp.]|nr:hypothetical protein [Candidatus Izimaplasma bacterium]